MRGLGSVSWADREVIEVGAEAGKELLFRPERVESARVGSLDFRLETVRFDDAGFLGRLEVTGSRSGRRSARLGG